MQKISKVTEFKRKYKEEDLVFLDNKSINSLIIEFRMGREHIENPDYFLEGVITDIINLRFDLCNGKIPNGIQSLNYSIGVEFKDVYSNVMIAATTHSILIKDDLESCYSDICSGLLEEIEMFNRKQLPYNRKRIIVYSRNKKKRLKNVKKEF